VLKGELSKLLLGYGKQDMSALVTGFTEGFSLNHGGLRITRESVNHKSALDNPIAVGRKLDEELSLGRIAGPFDDHPFSPFVVSPLGLVPKKEVNAFRLIHDLSYPRDASVNSHIDPQYTAVHYEFYNHIIGLMQDVGRG